MSFELLMGKGWRKLPPKVIWAACPITLGARQKNCSVLNTSFNGQEATLDAAWPRNAPIAVLGLINGSNANF